jgi:hypothetical protein
MKKKFLRNCKVLTALVATVAIALSTPLIALSDYDEVVPVYEVQADETSAVEASAATLEPIGSTINFSAGMVGNILSQPATSGTGSFSIRDNMLWLTPGTDAIAGVLPAVGGGHNLMNWQLPLNSGEWNVQDNNLLNFSFNWTPETTRPTPHSFDIIFMNGSDRVLTLKSTGENTNNNSRANTWFYTGNALFAATAPAGTPGGTNQPVEGSRVSMLSNVNVRGAGRDRQTLDVNVTLNLALQEATIVLTDGTRNFTSQTIALPAGNITSLQFAASRAAGNGWNRPNEWSTVAESGYGTGITNIAISGGTYTGEIPSRPATEVLLSGSATRNLEFGAGADATLLNTSVTAIVNPQNANNRLVNWSSNVTHTGAGHSDVIRLNTTGNSTTITAVGSGTAVVTATSISNPEISRNITVNVEYIPPITEPIPNFDTLLPLLGGGDFATWELLFGSNFPVNNFWGFSGSSGTGTGAFRNSVAELNLGGIAINHFLQWHVAGQSGNRNTQRILPESVSGSQAFVTFDWRPGEVGDRGGNPDQNVYDVRIVDAGNIPVVSLRMGRNNTAAAGGANRRIGTFTGVPMTDTNNAIFQHPDFHGFTNLMNLTNWHTRWYTVGIFINFDAQEATVTIVERGSTNIIESITMPINATNFGRFELQGHRTAGNNLNFTGNGIDNLYFLSREHADDTIMDVIPFEFLGRPPEPEQASARANLWQNWFIQVLSEETATVADINLPTNMNVLVASGDIVNVDLEWSVEEVPWHINTEEVPLVWNPNRTGVYTFAATIIDNDEAYNRMNVIPRLFVENRQGTPTTTEPRTAEWLDRGVVVVPARGGGNLIQWRILATEYQAGLTFNVFKNDSNTPLNTAPITTLNYVDTVGVATDSYRVEVIGTGEISPSVDALPSNFLEFDVQRPANRPNPAIAFGAPANIPSISYTINDMSVADVDGDGQYEVLVKWIPSEGQDPGLAARHTGETIFDLYTLEGEILWRINMGINITSGAHHNQFSFFNMDEGNSAQFGIKTADGTRVYQPQEDGTICDVRDNPVYVIGGPAYTALLDLSRGFYIGNVASHPDNVWVGGTRNPVTNLQNSGATGRVNNGPEFFTVFDGLTGMPIDTIEYFAPYGIRRGDWGDTNNNRSDRFLQALAYMPLAGEEGTAAYPTIIEGRQHYGPHHVTAIQLIDDELVTIWTFDFREWDQVGGNQGNHSATVHDVDRDGYDDVIFGSMVLNHRGEVRWSATGTRGTISTGHGDALHATVMRADTDEVYTFSPHEAPSPNNVTLYNAATGQPIWTYNAPSSDVGRGVAGNISPSPGFEVWASGVAPHNIITGERLNIFNSIGSGGQGIGPRTLSVNHLVYWTGSLYRQLLDGPNNGALSITGLSQFGENIAVLSTIQTFTGTVSANGTKANPGLQADILGDWREEVLVARNTHTSIRIYVTDFPTDNVIYTLMHDSAYRLAVNWQNNVYNQPPHLGFYLGADIQDRVDNRTLPVPNLRLTNAPEDQTYRAALQEIVNQAVGLSNANFSAANWRLFLPARTNAQNVLANPDATQAEIDNAANTLRNLVNRANN